MDKNVGDRAAGTGYIYPQQCAKYEEISLYMAAYVEAANETRMAFLVEWFELSPRRLATGDQAACMFFPFLCVCSL